MMRAVDVASVAAGAYVSIRGPSPALNNGAAHAHTDRRQEEPKVYPPVKKMHYKLNSDALYVHACI